MLNTNFIKKKFDRNGYIIIDTNFIKNNECKSIINKIYKDLNFQLKRKDLSNLGGYIMGI